MVLNIYILAYPLVSKACTVRKKDACAMKGRKPTYNICSEAECGSRKYTRCMDGQYTHG